MFSRQVWKWTGEQLQSKVPAITAISEDALTTQPKSRSISRSFSSYTVAINYVAQSKWIYRIYRFARLYLIYAFEDIKNCPIKCLFRVQQYRLFTLCEIRRLWQLWITAIQKASAKKYRLVPIRFCCPRCGLWVKFDEFAVHQGKEGGKLRSFCPPPSQKALRTLIAFPYSNTKRNK